MESIRKSIDYAATEPLYVFADYSTNPEKKKPIDIFSDRRNSMIKV